jgi:protein-S-isoprenylcysteine O-methyltransferase Ste14
MHRIYRKAALNLLQLPLVLGALVFLPAGTFDYWQGWLFVVVFFACSLAITIYLALNDPELLERRMRVGPRAEQDPSQKLIITVAFLSIAALPVLSALDHCRSWSQVPPALVIFGDVLIGLAYVGFYLVFRENTYGGATIQVTPGQTVVTTGPYAIVRHPMYSWALLMLLGIPLALGSWWGLLLLVPALAVILWRVREEERFLDDELPGYRDYRRQVRYRLLPLVW